MTMMKTISPTLKLSFRYQVHLQLNHQLYGISYPHLSYTVAVRLIKDYKNKLIKLFIADFKF